VSEEQEKVYRQMKEWLAKIGEHLRAPGLFEPFFKND